MSVPGPRQAATAVPAACDPTGLHVLSYARGFTLWYYRTAAPLDAVARPGYFDAARELLRAGDRITVGVHRRGRFAATRDFCVLAAAPEGVRLAPLSEALELA